MKKEEPVQSYFRKVVLAPDLESGGRIFAVPVSHRDLDVLVGRLMQMCDLIGDVAQRKALKDTIKQISRHWLDNLYQEAGYDKFTGLPKGIEAIEI